MPIHGLKPSSKPTYPSHFDIESVIRPNILALHPYRCARDDYQEGILLDANENALGHVIPASSLAGLTDQSSEAAKHLVMDLNRYPDPAQREIKSRIARLRGVVDENGMPKDDYMFLGVGSDEVIDLLMRVCVAPGKESILTTPPTYGMYAVCAQVNDIGVKKVPLRVECSKEEMFQLDINEMKKAIDENSSIKLIFLCSPGNPTGTLISLKDIEEILNYEKFKGVVVVDEAYIDFSPPGSSAVSLVEKYSNICVLQTLSKSFGLAAIRLGVAIAQPPLIQVLTNTKAPYNISTPTAALALSALSPSSLAQMSGNISTLISSRGKLQETLSELGPSLGLGGAIGANNANFLMITVLNKESGKPDNVRSERVYTELAEKERVVVRFRGKEYGCAGCLRITVGSEDENAVLVQKLKEVLSRL